MKLISAAASDPKDLSAASGLPTFSIVTICLNAAETLRRTIESVLGQTRAPIEYIVIDGGSTDGSQAIAASYGTRITRLVSEPDRGISDAFNKGIALATGDFVGLLNADDWYEPTTLARVAALAANADVIHGDLQHWHGDQKEYLAKGAHESLLKEMSVHHPTVFVRRTTYQKLGGFKLSYLIAMDYELLLRFHIAGQRFVYVPRPLANMPLTGLSARHWQRGIKECCRAKIENHLSPVRARIYCAKQLLRSALSRFLQSVGLGGIVKIYRSKFSLVRKSY